MGDQKRVHSKEKVTLLNLQEKPQVDKEEYRLQKEIEGPEEEDTANAVQPDNQPQMKEEASPLGTRRSIRRR